MQQQQYSSMTYYPVIIPTLNRISHFRDCVESLSRCTHADKTELVIGLDYPPSDKYVEGYKQIKEYIPTIVGFRKVTLFEHKKNLGPVGNYLFLVDYCKESYEAYIGTEDDNVFSPCFLDYMNKALNMFHDDEKILTVSGYNFKGAYDQGEYTSYLCKENCGWGTGYWKHKEEKIGKIIKNYNYFVKALYVRSRARIIIEAYPALYRMLNDMIMSKQRWDDVMRSVMMLVQGCYQLKPAISLVRNCGYDGSGLHCGEDNFGLSKQQISDEAIFDFSKGVGSADTNINEVALFNYNLSEDESIREMQIQQIQRIYRANMNPLLYHAIDFCKSFRSKVALRTRIKSWLYTL